MDKDTLKNAFKGKITSIRVSDIEKSNEYLKKKGYEAKQIIGVGGFGIVLEAVKMKFKDKVAIKLIYVEQKGET